MYQPKHNLKICSLVLISAFLFLSGCTTAKEPALLSNNLQKSLIPWENYDQCYPNPLSPCGTGGFTVGGQPTTCVTGYCDKPPRKCVCETGYTGRY